MSKPPHPRALGRATSFKNVTANDLDLGEIKDAMVAALRLDGSDDDDGEMDLSEANFIRQLHRQFPDATTVRPSINELVDSLMHIPANDTELPFGTGQWVSDDERMTENKEPELTFTRKTDQQVEFYDTDQMWHLAKIKRVVARPTTRRTTSSAATTKKSELDYFYNVGIDKLVPPFLVRVPEASIVRVFGTRPLVFQQWCMLRVMRMVRFQEGHQRDFETFSFAHAAEGIWNEWLCEPRNLAFKIRYESFPDAGVKQKVSEEYCLRYVRTRLLTPCSNTASRLHPRPVCGYGPPLEAEPAGLAMGL